MRRAMVPTRSPGIALGSLVAVVALAALITSDLAAQQLPLKTAPPSGAVLICGEAGDATPPPSTAGDAEGASRLVSAATQAMLLGDLDGALDFLDRALVLDPAAAEAVYLRARILQRQGAGDAAAAALCQYLRLDATSASAGEVRQRLDDVRDAGAGHPLLATYRRALELEREGRLREAEDAFTEVLSARPAAAVALYNRAIVRAALGREDAARADLVAYLELDPGAPDAREVRQSLGAAGAAVAGPIPPVSTGPRASAAFITGALIPGGGQYYTGRPVLGAAVTMLAGGVLAGGILHERTTIRCLDASATECPEDQIASRETERPMLMPAIGVAAGLALIAAIEAATHVRSSSQRRQPASSATGATTRLLPTDGIRYAGAALHLELLRLHF